jgi:hypothetical protein
MTGTETLCSTLQPLAIVQKRKREEKNLQQQEYYATGIVKSHCLAVIAVEWHTHTNTQNLLLIPSPISVNGLFGLCCDDELDNRGKKPYQEKSEERVKKKVERIVFAFPDEIKSVETLSASNNPHSTFVACEST